MLYILGLIHYRSNEIEKAKEYLSQVIAFRDAHGTGVRVKDITEDLFTEMHEVQAEIE